MQKFRVAKSSFSLRQFSVNLSSEYVPEKQILFKNGSYQLYVCRPETMKLKKFVWYPVPPILGLSGLIMYKTVFWSGFLWVFFPTFPLAFFITARKNIIENCEASIETIDLLQGGKTLRIKDLSGKVRLHPIESLRRATDQEIIKINRAGGPAFVERMKDFYPVMVQSTKNGTQEDGRAEVKEVSGDNLIDVLFIDHKGVVADKALL